MTHTVSDWTGRFTGIVTHHARPRNPAEVAAALAEARARGMAVTTRGGNTSLVGGAVPASDRPTMLLETTGLRRLEPVDVHTGQVTVGAGITLAELQRHAAAAGWYYGVDLAARDSATVGGTIATNAGGIRVVRYGMTRAQVVGVEAVLADGSIIDDTSGLLKNNTGYPLSALLTGSEGTLGIITAARMALHAPPPASSLALLAVPSLAEAMELVGAIRRSGADLLAAEAIDQAGRELLLGLDGPSIPTELGHGEWYLFIEVGDGGTGDGLEPLSEVDDLIVAIGPAEQRRLWEVREGMTDAWGVAATTAGTVVQKFDVSLPTEALDPFVAEVRALVAPPAQLGMFGHVADGNLHLEIVAPDGREWDEPVLTAVAEHGGSVSAEHGIGLAKRDYLGLTRSAAEIEAMRAIKRALDPDDLLNPGIIFPPSG